MEMNASCYRQTTAKKVARRREEEDALGRGFSYSVGSSQEFSETLKNTCQGYTTAFYDLTLIKEYESMLRAMLKNTSLSRYAVH
ncbi:hypothetical protein V1478_010987 [Vespula squamosa]|uniref:Uncharacterized protein n=1 Tax=Vespula squamosa TaxID=30214 RepID=A0ABD2AIP2_VESSQ